MTKQHIEKAQKVLNSLESDNGNPYHLVSDIIAVAASIAHTEALIRLTSDLDMFEQAEEDENEI